MTAMKGRVLPKEKEEAKVVVSFGSGYYDGGRIVAKFKGQFFNCDQGETACCGVQDMNGWDMNFKDFDTCKKIMDALLAKFKEANVGGEDSDDRVYQGAYLMFNLTKANKEGAECNQPFLEEWLQQCRGAYCAPWRLNKNSGNLIQPWMVAY